MTVRYEKKEVVAALVRHLVRSRDPASTKFIISVLLVIPDEWVNQDEKLLFLLKLKGLNYGSVKDNLRVCETVLHTLFFTAR